jgi:hypothetical protein
MLYTIIVCLLILISFFLGWCVGMGVFNYLHNQDRPCNCEEMKEEE